MNEITSTTNLGSLQTPGVSPKQVSAPDSTSFGQVLKQSLNDVNKL